MPVKKICLGGTVVFDRDEIMDAIYGITPPLSVQIICFDMLGDNWIASNDQGDVWGDTSKLYRFLLMIANQASDDSCLLSNGETIHFKRSGVIRIITDSTNAQLARAEYGRTGVSWFWCIHEVDKVRVPVTRHFINFTESQGDVGKYSQDQIVDIVGSLSLWAESNGNKSGALLPSITERSSHSGLAPNNATRSVELNFRASNSDGVNVGAWVQPRATALRLAFYVGFLKQSQYKDL